MQCNKAKLLYNSLSENLTDEVIGFFSIDLILPAALGHGVYSASNRNEYQELNK
jgi:hypothetical protein